MILGTLLVLPLTLPATIADLPRLGASDWGWLLFLGIGCTVVAYIVWYAALQTLEASTVAAYVYLVPLFSLVWAAALLGERPTVAGVLGGAMVLAGVLLSERVGPRYAKRPSASRTPPSPRPASRPRSRAGRVRASR